MLNVTQCPNKYFVTLGWHLTKPDRIVLIMKELVIDLEAEKNEILKRYRALLRACKPTMQKGDKRMIRKAFDMALESHKDMRRKSGEPYIYHPIAVAQIAAEEIGLGPTSIVCALLHDVVEDTNMTLDDIEREFGKKVALIIDGLTKISGVFGTNSSLQAENFRKMLLTGNYSVKEVGLYVGYANLSNFATAFKKEFDILPSQAKG